MKKYKAIGIVSLFLIGMLLEFIGTSPINAHATDVSGIIGIDTTWNSAGSPYVVTGDVLVFPDVTLTIEDGTEILFYNGTSLTVRGTLNVVGTPSEYVVFRSYSSQDKVAWLGIYIENEVGGKAEINYAEFYNAGSAIHVGSCWDGGPVNIYDSVFINNHNAVGGYAGWNIIIERCYFEDNTYAINTADKIISNSTFINNEYGLYKTERISVYDSMFTQNNVALYGGRGELQGNQIYKNGIGIQAFFEGFSLTNNNITENNMGLIISDYDGYVPDIKYNDLYNNFEFNLESRTNVDVDATNNYWGTTDASVIAQLIWDVYDDLGLGEVFYEPFLTSKVVSGCPPLNFPPVADAQPETQTINIGEEAWFSANASFDPDGWIVSYDWDFGDGMYGSGLMITHIYNTPGDYTVTLTVTDNDNLTDNDNCIVTVLEVVSPPPPDDDDWPMFNHDPQHTGFSSSDAPGTASLLWTFTGFWPMTSPSIADGMVFVVYGEPFLIALNESTGEIIWSYEIPGLPSQPVIANDKVFVSSLVWGNGSDEIHIYCFDQFCGEILWEWNSAMFDWPPFLYFWVEGAPLTSANNHVYFGLSGVPLSNISEWSVMICLNDSTGEIIWNVNVADYGLIYMQTPLTIAYNMIFVSSWDGLYALDENNGDLIWKSGIIEPIMLETAAAVIDGKIFIGSDNTNFFYCLDANTGSIIWKTCLNDDYIFTSPAVAYGKVFVGANEISGGNDSSEYIDPIYALDQNTGEVIWRYEAPPAVISTPAVADNKVFNSYSDGTICALDEGSGSVIWTYPTQPPSLFRYQSLAIAYGKLFVSMGDTLYVFGPGDSGNQPPIANAEPDVQMIEAGEEAWFSASSSFDPDGYIVSYDWDFGDGTYGTGITITHLYTAIGIYNVTLTVTDDEEAKGYDLILVIVEQEGEPPENLPPIAFAEPPIQMIFVGEEAWFSGDLSYDPDGYIVAYDWDFGDGTNGSGVTITHNYTQFGFYNVTLTITDDDGATGSFIVFVIVEQEGPPENQPPVAIAEPPLQIVIVGEEAWFSGNGSYDPDGYIISYDWDFGDGTNGSGVEISHVYTIPGDYIVTLTVRDDDNATDIDTIFVTVQEQPPQNRPPVADAGKDRFAIPYELLTFDGSGSFDLDGIIVNYTWDFGDGNTASGMINTHAYTDFGTYIVTLMVTDNEGAQDTETCIVFIENNPPRAEIEPESQTVYVGEKAWFSGNCSYDQEGNILSYFWDFGDGTSSYGVSTYHIYNDVGIYTVTLTVIDDQFYANIDYAVVIVLENPMLENIPPSAIAKVESMAYVGDIVTFDGSSSDDTDGYIVSFEWNFGDGTFGEDEITVHTYITLGIYTITLTVTDDRGATDTVRTTLEIIEKNEQPHPAYLEISKTKISGPDEVQIHTYAEWTLEVVITNKGGRDALEVVMSDVIPAEFELIGYSSSQGSVIIENNPGNMSPLFITWSVGTLSPDESATLTFKVGTTKNPAGKQEFTSPGTYIINKGCSAEGIDEATGEIISADFESTIEVVAMDSENLIETIIEPNDSNLEPVKSAKPILILTAGLINIATFEVGFERIVPVEVTSYFGDVHNVHIELIDDGGLEIEIIPIVSDVPEEKIVRFYIKIKRPELSEDIPSTGITIRLKAVGEEAESNIEYIDIMIRGETEDSSANSGSVMVSTLGVATIIAIIAALIGRRFL
ncbi:MAG: PKD domain-containing protein [Methanomassiliicoccales archaeon]|nr:MAG: PKD domain-containing protein [Methanomassiliicoccales archaeon]